MGKILDKLKNNLPAGENSLNESCTFNGLENVAIPPASVIPPSDIPPPFLFAFKKMCTDKGSYDPLMQLFAVTHIPGPESLSIQMIHITPPPSRQQYDVRLSVTGLNDSTVFGEFYSLMPSICLIEGPEARLRTLSSLAR